MILTQRYADIHTASKYPLDCSGQLPWQLTNGVHKASIKLPDLPAGSIVVPSLALLGNDDYRYQIALRLGASRWALHHVPCESLPTPESDPAVTTHIDCFHIHELLCAAELEIEIEGLPTPTEYLFALSVRTLDLSEVPTPTGSVVCPAPPAISQMGMGKDLESRICSPTCTTMLLTQFGKNPDLAEVIAACFDPVSKLHGIWPLALRAASRAGCLGAVEVFEDWDAPQQIIAAGLPLIASIRFAANGLPGSPLPSTHGHLVVLHGIGPDEVLVCDPAGADTAAVPRRYETSSFAQAWLKHRGAAYILLP